MSPTAEEQHWAATSQLRGPAFAEPAQPAARLIVFGAVPLAAAMCRLARGAGLRPYVVDPRPRFATRSRFPDAEAVIVAWPHDAFAELGGIDDQTAIAVLTHDPVLDDPALIIALRSEAAYVGAMGSQRTQAARRERLSAAGLTTAELSRLSGPTGLDIGARTAQETALSVLAEVVAVGRGRAGGRLTETTGPIHPVSA